MKNNWNGLIKIEHIQHLDANGKVKWEARDLYNILHTKGQEFILKALFIGGKTNNLYIPNQYYFGLDDRSVLSASDTMATAVSAGSGEPSGGGYVRQTVSATDAFNVALTEGGVNQAVCPIISFSSSSLAWGPVKNLFLTNDSGNAGYLIASVALNNPLTVLPSESISMRMGLSLQDCSTCT